MSKDLDWTIEYETLPADATLLPEPVPPPPWRPPRWLWLVLASAAIATGIILYLWSLGGRAEPLPNPDAERGQLEATVQLEIAALRNGDEELFAQLQDDPSHRSNMQPTPHGWFSVDGDQAGDVELVDLQLLDDDSALAEIKLNWDGVPYRLFWVYRRENERWLHTDWQKVELGPEETLALNHVKVMYNQAFQGQAEALADQVDSYLSALCDVLTCPTHPITVSLELDPYYVYYNVTEVHEAGMEDDESLGLHYRLPAPLQIRWPWDKQPEPLVLGSLGRALAYELLVQDKLGGLAPENKAAVTLSTFWLAHQLLGLESPPTTRWLDEAVGNDGLPAFVAFFSTLQEGVHPSVALAKCFRAESVEAIKNQPDLFGWRAEVLNPGRQVKFHLRVRPQRGISIPSDTPDWTRELGLRFDWEVDPWAPDGRVYKRAVPDIVDVVYLGSWATASAPVNENWAAALFFLQVNGSWLLADFAKASMTEQLGVIDDHSIVADGPFTVTYWSWDEPYITETLEILHFIHDKVTSNFKLEDDRNYIYAFIPFRDTDGTVYEPEPEAIQVLSRTSPDRFGEFDGSLYQSMLVSNLIYRMLVEETWGPSAGRWLLHEGLIIWQTEEVLAEQGYESLLSLWLPAWMPPTSSTEDGWIAVEDIWSKWESDLLPNHESSATSVIYYVVDEYGTGTLPMMLNALKTASSMEEWVSAVTGRSLADFTTDWREWVITNWPPANH